jgi:RNA 2',3'-cyclic 3'-phosphodiesterase
VARDRSKRLDAKPLRLFVAVKVPSETRDVIDEAIDPWRERFPRARWVPPENWHITLKFLGATYPRLRGWVEAGIGRAASAQAPFEMRLRCFGSFPSPGRARVLWAGPGADEEPLSALASAVDDELSGEFPRERRAFHAHLTVARSDPPLRLSAAFAETPLDAEPFTVEELVLFRSHLRRPAPRYEPLASFPLG